MHPHYHLIMTHSARCHNDPTPPPIPHLLAAHVTSSESFHVIAHVPIPAAARSKIWACGLSLAGNAGSNPARGMDVFSHVSVVCCQVEVSTSGWSLVQRSPTECSVSEYDREASIVRSWPSGGCRAREKLICVACSAFDCYRFFDRFFPWFDSTAAENAVFILRKKPYGFFRNINPFLSLLIQP